MSGKSIYIGSTWALLLLCSERPSAETVVRINSGETDIIELVSSKFKNMSYSLVMQNNRGWAIEFETDADYAMALLMMPELEELSNKQWRKNDK